MIELTSQDKWREDVRVVLQGQWRPDATPHLLQIMRDLRACLDAHLNMYARGQLSLHAGSQGDAMQEVLPLLADLGDMVRHRRSYRCHRRQQRPVIACSHMCVCFLCRQHVAHWTEFTAPALSCLLCHMP